MHERIIYLGIIQLSCNLDMHETNCWIIYTCLGMLTFVVLISAALGTLWFMMLRTHTRVRYQSMCPSHDGLIDVLHANPQNCSACGVGYSIINAMFCVSDIYLVSGVFIPRAEERWKTGPAGHWIDRTLVLTTEHWVVVYDFALCPTPKRCTDHGDHRGEKSKKSSISTFIE
jgi:hypothetical protein